MPSASAYLLLELSILVHAVGFGWMELQAIVTKVFGGAKSCRRP
jgi:hypothetical protein